MGGGVYAGGVLTGFDGIMKPMLDDTVDPRFNERGFVNKFFKCLMLTVVRNSNSKHFYSNASSSQVKL